MLEIYCKLIKNLFKGVQTNVILFLHNASVNSSCDHPPTPGDYCGAFSRLVSPGGGAFSNFALPGGNPEVLTHTHAGATGID